MGLEFNMEASAQNNGQAQKENSLPRELRFAAALLCWHVGQDQSAPYGPLAELVRCETCQLQHLTRFD